jgi:hypothetical protein
MTATCIDNFDRGFITLNKEYGVVNYSVANIEIVADCGTVRCYPKKIFNIRTETIDTLDIKIKRVESFLEQKKFENKFDCRESSKGIVTGLEIALAILKD